MKRLLTVLMIAVLLAVSMATVTTAYASEEIVKLVYATPFQAVAPRETQDVIDAINEITRAEIGVEIEPQFINLSDYNAQTNLMISGGEQVDVYLSNASLITDAVQGKILPLTEEFIMEHAPGAFEAIGKDYMQAAFINGAYYGFPTLRDFARRPKILYNGDLADEYGIDVSNVHTPEDFTAGLAQVKEKIPGIYPIGPVEDRVVTHAISVNYDRLSDTAQGDTCVLLNYGQDDPLKVVNYYETEEYKKAVNLVREWYLAGYVYPDSSTDVDAGAAGLAAKKYFCYSTYGHPRSIMDLYAMTQGMDVRELFFDDILTLSTTEAVTGCTMCVAATSENPEKALEFINLMYTDPRLVNLLNYGIEGKHWVKVEGSKQLINYPDGVDESNCGYHIAQLWYYGNSLIANIWEDGGRDGLWDEIREFNDTAIKSKALGFAFDLSPVKTEAAAIANVCNEYKRALGCGEVDPAVYIPKFNEALKAAGVDTFIAECQKQLDAWVEAK